MRKVWALSTSSKQEGQKFQAQGRREGQMKSRLPSPGQRLSPTALEGEVIIDTLVIGDDHLNKLRIKSNIEDVGQSQSELCAV